MNNHFLDFLCVWFVSAQMTTFEICHSDASQRKTEVERGIMRQTGLELTG